jgi:hypothetical protein
MGEPEVKLIPPSRLALRRGWLDDDYGDKGRQT